MIIKFIQPDVKILKYNMEDCGIEKKKKNTPTNKQTNKRDAI